MRYTKIILLSLVLATLGMIVVGYFRTKDKVIVEPTLIIQDKIYTQSAWFTAYTLSADETDDSPCIGSRSLDLCKLKPVLNARICASRDIPLDTVIDIEGIGECIILDRMNIRYEGTGAIDIEFDTKEEANKFGKQVLRYNIIM